MAPYTLSEYDPKTAIPSLEGKVILITGGTAGLGTQTILDLIPHNPSLIFFTGRNTSAAEKVIESANRISSGTEIRFLPCDFTSLASVKSAAQEVISRTSRLDILMCNAGVMAIPKGLTKDGYSNQFGINHLAHAMLIKHLLPLLLSTQKTNSDARIIINTSLGSAFATTISFDKLKTEHDRYLFGAFRRYGESKLANMLYARELARHYPQILSVAVHPGVIDTGLISGLAAFNRWFTYATTVGTTISVEDGVKNQLWAATAGREEMENGGFYEPVGVVGRVMRASRKEGLAGELWEWTQRELEGF